MYRLPLLLLLSCLLDTVSALATVCTQGVYSSLAPYSKYDAIQLNCYRSFRQFAPVTIENQQTSTTTAGTYTITAAKTTVDAGSVVTRTGTTGIVTAPTVTIVAPPVTSAGTTIYISLPGAVTITNPTYTYYSGSTITSTDANTALARTSTTVTVAASTTTSTISSGTSTSTETVTSYSVLPELTSTMPATTTTTTVYIGGGGTGACPTGGAVDIAKAKRRRMWLDRRGKEDDFNAILAAQGVPTTPIFSTFCSCYATVRTVTTRPTLYIYKTTTITPATATTTRTTTVTPASATTTYTTTSTPVVLTTFTATEGGIGAITIQPSTTVNPTTTITITSTSTSTISITPTSTTRVTVVSTTITVASTTITTVQNTVSYVPTETATTTVNLGGGGGTLPQWNYNIQYFRSGNGAQQCSYQERSAADVQIVGSVSTGTTTQSNVNACKNACDQDTSCQVYKYVAASQSCTLYLFPRGGTNAAYPIAGSNSVGVKTQSGAATCPPSVVYGEYCSGSGIAIA